MYFTKTKDRKGNFIKNQRDREERNSWTKVQEKKIIINSIISIDTI